jgi:hypothetical protein
VYKSNTPKLQDQNLVIGTSENTSKVLDGLIDEVRICAAARSEDWVYAQWLSMTDNYITYGSIEYL